MIYLHTPTFADILSLKCLCDTHAELEGGYFVEEIDYPWHTWWVIKSKWRAAKQKQILEKLPWEVGEPTGKTRKIDWPNLLRKLALEPDPSHRIHTSVVLRTPSEAVFMQVIKDHYLLQQGELYFCSPGETERNWLIKILHPSLWSLCRLPADASYTIYNEIPELQCVYLARGCKLNTLTSPLGRFHTERNTTILLHQDASLIDLKAHWQPITTIIDLKSSGARILSGAETTRISVPIRLVDEVSTAPPALWRVDDAEKLRRTLSRAGVELLDGFRAWFAASGHIWLLSEGDYHDRGLAAQFTEQFASFTRLASRVFIPRGKSLMPRLTEAQILDTHDCPNSDYLCLDAGPDEPCALILPAQDLKDLRHVIVYSAELAVRSLDAFESFWSFRFHDLIPRPIISGERPPSKTAESVLEETAEPQTAKAPRKKRTRRRSASQVERETEHILTRIREIDALLFRDVENAKLWRERAGLSASMDNPDEALAAALTAVIIDGDHRTFFRTVKSHHETSPRFEAMFDGEPDEDEKGRLLAAMRVKTLPAESNYSLQLYYAARFEDPDVFDAATSAMRSGYHDGSHPFIRLETDAGPPVSAGEMVADGIELAELKTHISQFLAIVEACADPALQGLIQKQFSTLLRENIGQGLPVRQPAQLRGHLKTLWDLLDTPQPVTANLEKSTQLWLDTVAMSGLRQAKPEALFVGELYRPVITWTFVEESQSRVENIFQRFSDGKADWEADLQLPEQASDFDDIRQQRLLLYLVTRYGPLQAFESFILDFQLGNHNFNHIVRNCDVFRLNLLYGRPVNQEHFFQAILADLPQAADAYSFPDFRDAAENVLYCLFVSDCADRQYYLEQLLRQTLAWLQTDRVARNPMALDELLGIVSYLEAAFISPHLPRSARAYQAFSKRKGLWMDHAHQISHMGFSTLRQHYGD